MPTQSGMAKLSEFLTARRKPTTQADWAKRFGISRSYLSELMSGKYTPSLKLAKRIQEQTKGRVPMSSWVRDD